MSNTATTDTNEIIDGLIDSLTAGHHRRSRRDSLADLDWSASFDVDGADAVTDDHGNEVAWIIDGRLIIATADGDTVDCGEWARPIPA